MTERSSCQMGYNFNIPSAIILRQTPMGITDSYVCIRRPKEYFLECDLSFRLTENIFYYLSFSISKNSSEKTAGFQRSYLIMFF